MERGELIPKDTNALVHEDMYGAQTFFDPGPFDFPGGIGRALVQVFHQAGYYVIGTDQVAEPCDWLGRHYVSADLARYAEDAVYAGSNSRSKSI